jgi:hypothetical protein
MNNLLEKNIFYQKCKEKYNPDVLVKKSTIEKTRSDVIFKKNDLVYNSITNNIPDNINSQKDLELKKDLPLTNIELILQQKNLERLEEDNNNSKNIKQKVIINDDETNNKSVIYNELKNEQIEYSKIRNNQIKNNKDRYDDIMVNLKNLGIINN